MIYEYLLVQYLTSYIYNIIYLISDIPYLHASCCFKLEILNLQFKSKFLISTEALQEILKRRDF